MPLTANPVSQWPVNGNGEDTFGGHNMSSVSPSGYTAGKIGQALVYDSIDDKSVVLHNSDFTFGDGTNDSPFSIFQWVKMTDATIFRMFYKNVSTLAAEYGFSTNSADKLTIGLYDATVGNSIGRTSTATLTADQGSYILVGFTYDGSGVSTGIKLYKGDQRITTVDASGGTYVAMQPSGGDVWIGASQFGGFADGEIDVTYIFNYALSDGGVAEGNTVGAGSDIDFLWHSGAGRELGGIGGGIPFFFDGGHY